MFVLINASPQNTMRMFEPFIPIGIPIGLASLYAVLRQDGKEVCLYDEQVTGDCLPRICKQFPDFQQRLIFGISVLTASYGRSLDLAALLRQQYPNSIIVFGGVHPSALPEEVLENPQVDLVAQGEMEEHIVALYSALMDDQPLDAIPNLYYRSAGTIVQSVKSDARVDLNNLPMMPYELFTNPQYNLGVVVSSRGCPYRCIFCSNRVVIDARYRFKAARLIADEIELLYRKFGQRHIVFADDNLLVIKDRVYELLKELRDRELVGKIEFSFQGRADNTDEQLLKALFDHGFYHIAFGMETGSERVMKVIHKGETVQECYDAVQLARRVGFRVTATFMMGMPTETHEERMESVRLAIRSGLRTARFNNATPYPGTRLIDIAKAEGGLNIVGRYDNFLTVSTIVENPFKPITLSYVPPGMTEKELKNDILFGYFCLNLNVYKLLAKFKRQSGGRRVLKPKMNFGQKILYTVQRCALMMMLSLKFSIFLVNCLMRKECAVSLKDFSLLWIKTDDPGSHSLP